MFQKHICRQLSNHFDNILCPKQCLFSTIDKWKKVVDKKVLGALLTDLSKAFDCICHDLLVAKLNADDLSFPAIK